MEAGERNMLKTETMLLSHARNANFINRTMHKIADSKKAINISPKKTRLEG